MQKKIFLAGAVFMALGIAVMGSGRADAQLFPYTGTSTAPSSSVVDATTTASATSSNAATPATTTDSSASSSNNADIAPMTATPSTTASATPNDNAVNNNNTISSSSSDAGSSTAFPATVPATGTAGTGASIALGTGYLQLNGLTVVSVSGMSGTANSTATAPTEIIATAPTTGATCEQFGSMSATTGTSVACPVPTAQMTPNASTSSPAYYDPYTIIVDNATQIEANDRTPATLASIVPGDTINAYGYYDGTGTLDAQIVRDLSRGEAAGTTATAGNASDSTTIASLRAQLNNLETLVLQLAAELGVSTSGMMMPQTATGTTPTFPVACPMMPAGTTSTTGCPPLSAPPGTSTVTSPIYE